MKPLHFFLPLGTGSRWDNNELRYCLRSLEKNCKYDFDVTVYATEPVEWLQNVNLKIIPRFYPTLASNLNDNRSYENFYDTLNKVRNFVYTETNIEDFIYIYDDVCLIKELEYEDYFKVFALCEYTEVLKDTYSKYKHGRTINSSVRVITNEFEMPVGEIEPWNFETHLPRSYDMSELNTLFSSFDFCSTYPPYALATLYYNYYDVLFLSLYENPIKAEFFMEEEDDIISCSSETYEAVLRGVKDKWWLNYNDMGLNEHLKRYLQESFPEKSRFER